MKTINWLPKLFLYISFLFPITVSALFTQSAFAQFTSPPGQGSPKGTAGGGSRPIKSLCTQPVGSQETLVAMAPTGSVGFTSSQTPTLWVYIPNTTAKTLEFSLVTQEEGVYQTNVSITDTRLLKVTLPATVSLTVGKIYNWKAALVCNPKQRTEDWVVNGWIQRQPIDAEFQRKLTGATIEQQVKLYAQAGFWYEALNAYLQLRQMQPGSSNLPLLGADLLKFAGLDKIAANLFPTQAPR